MAPRSLLLVASLGCGARAQQSYTSAPTLGSSIASSPALSSDGSTLFVGSDDHGLYAVAASTGAVRWRYATGGAVASSPAVDSRSQMVYVGSSDSRLHAVHAQSGEPSWTFRTANAISSSPVVSRDGRAVYVGGQDGHLYAIRSATGSQLWNVTMGGGGCRNPTPTCGAVWSSPALSPSGELVLVGSHDGLLHAIDARTGREAWAAPTGKGWTDSSPAVSADGELALVGSEDASLYCFERKSGRLVWRFRTGFGVWSSPTLSGRVAFFGSSDHRVYAVDVATGAQVWSFATGGEVLSSPAVSPDGGRVLVGSFDKKLYAIDAATGVEVWSVAAESGVYSSPAFSRDGEVAYVGSLGADGHVYALNASTGRVLWRAAGGGAPALGRELASSDGPRLPKTDPCAPALEAGEAAGTLLRKVLLPMRGALRAWRAYYPDVVSAIAQLPGRRTRVVEVGTAYGGLARHLLKHLPKAYYLYVVDPFIPNYDVNDLTGRMMRGWQKKYRLTDAQVCPARAPMLARRTPLAPLRRLWRHGRPHRGALVRLCPSPYTAVLDRVGEGHEVRLPRPRLLRPVHPAQPAVGPRRPPLRRRLRRRRLRRRAAHRSGRVRGHGGLVAEGDATPAHLGPARRRRPDHVADPHTGLARRADDYERLCSSGRSEPIGSSRRPRPRARCRRTPCMPTRAVACRAARLPESARPPRPRPIPVSAATALRAL